MTPGISRRALARFFAPAVGLASIGAPPRSARDFPAHFLWGSATSAYQVEGAAREGGRGDTIWDVFARRPGAIADGSTGDRSADFFHRFDADIALMKSLGLKAFRFSVSWSRLFPDGTGALDRNGLDFYERLVDALLAAGIEPFCTLFHWDLPEALQRRGGWQNRDTAQAFAAYAGTVAAHLSDRVRHFMTMNEIRTFVEQGHRDGIHAPGLRLDAAQVAQLTHHAVLAHGLAVRAIRAAGRPQTKVGLADNPRATTPVFDRDDHVAAARLAMREENAAYLGAILDGRYSDAYLRGLGRAAPTVAAGDLSAISSPLDFVGLNIYTPTYVRAVPEAPGYVVVPTPAAYPHMYSDWLTIGPEALFWGPKLVADVWGVTSLFITENGTSCLDALDATGEVQDTDRVMYLRNYLLHLQRAVEAGVPVDGYFVWSLLDNFEWADGYTKRFGITYVDFQSLRRVLKLSAHFYRDVVAKNAVV